jgi:NAD(P)-dependent dehydrogenase (short-subunit alcohol dehydrogenase family)
VATGSFHGRVAFVTGAARGIGQGIASALAAAGADLVLTDLDDCTETVSAVEKTGRRVVVGKADVRDQEALDALVRRGAEELGGLDVVVANAGLNGWSSFWEISEEEWRKLIDVNLGGVFRTFKAAVPRMIERGRGGSLIAISSVAGLKALPTQAHYTAAKHGVVGLVRTAAIELGPHRIRVNSVHPWGVDTRLARDAHTAEVLAENPAFVPSYSSILREPVIAQPSDIANAVVWLASDAARCVTGIQLPVDMGATTV